MISFRFHLVSLTAVFLALALGIGMGVTVVDRATVEGLEAQIDRVRQQRDVARGESDARQAELGQWERFSEEAGDEFVRGRLAGVPVLLVVVEGVASDPLDRFRQTLVASGASLQGTLQLTAKLRLESDDDVEALASLLDVDSDRAETVRRTAITRLIDEWLAGRPAEPPAGPPGPTLLARLIDAGFAKLETPQGASIDPAVIPLAGTRFVVVSSPDAEVGNQSLAVPLARELAVSGGARVLAAEPGPYDAEAGDEPSYPFVGHLRDDAGTAARLTTVDNLADFRGRLAAVLALAALQDGVTGHFGTGPGATRMVPEAR